MKNTLLFAFFIGSARPPETIQSNSVGRLATKEILSNSTFVGSARPLSMIFNSTRVERAPQRCPISNSFFVGSARPPFTIDCIHSLMMKNIPSKPKLADCNF